MKVSKMQRGSAEEFMNAVQDKIAELGGTSDSVKSSRIVGQNDDLGYKERYMHNLIGDLQSELSDILTYIDYEPGDDGYIEIEVDYGTGNIVNHKIPLFDLKFDSNNIDADITYITNVVRSSESDSIDSATNSCGVSTRPDVDIEDCDSISADVHDADYLGGYYTLLTESIKEQVGNECDSLIFDMDDNNIYVTIGYDDKAWELSVPLADLTLDVDAISDDVDYISNSIIGTLEYGLDAPEEYDIEEVE